MKTWFTADTHFDHDKIIKLSGRPFKDVTHMNQELVVRWNKKVRPDDGVIFLGDFAFKRAKYFKERLNGDIFFLKGNHDSRSFTKIKNLVINIGGKEVFCTHDPDDLNGYYELNLVGHVHEAWRQRNDFCGKHLIRKTINVGVDVWNFEPIDINTIKKMIEDAKKYYDINVKYKR